MFRFFPASFHYFEVLYDSVIVQRLFLSIQAHLPIEVTIFVIMLSCRPNFYAQLFLATNTNPCKCVSYLIAIPLTF